MRFLTLSEVLGLHRRVAEQSGGLMGIRDLGGLESSLGQPRMTFGGAGSLPHSHRKGFRIKNHPFVDGNKRTAHAAMETPCFEWVRNPGRSGRSRGNYSPGGFWNHESGRLQQLASKSCR